MRIADKMAYEQVNRSISKNRAELTGLQNQAATQKRVTKPSDDPVAASRVLASRIEQRGTEQFIKNLNYAKGFLDYSEQSLSELTEVIMRAKELAISQANDASASAQSRKIVAQEAQQLYDQSIQIANRKLGERFIFGGFKTTAAPFAPDGEYLGDKGEIKIHIDKDSFINMNLPGSVVFEGQGLSKDGFTLKNQIQPKNVSDLKKARNEFPDKFRDPQTGEPKNPGEISANEAPPASLKGPPQPSVPNRGPASIRTTENVAPTNAAPVNSASANAAPANEKTNLNTETNQAIINPEDLFPDGVNIFKSLEQLKISLQTDDKTGIQESIDKLDDSLQQIVIARTTLGSRVMTIDNALNSMHTNIVDTKATISQLEDVDAFEVISDINKNEAALQATLQTSGKIIQKSLMDFIS